MKVCAGTQALSTRLRGVLKGTTIIASRNPMNHIATTVAIVVLLFVAAAEAQAPKRLALVGGMLLTGYEVPPIHRAAILIEGDKIVAAGPASDVKIGRASCRERA